MTTSKNNHRPRVARAVSKVSTKSREDRSILVDNTAPACPIWQANADLAAAGNDLIQAGIELGIAVKAAQVLAAERDTARDELITLRIAWDHRFNLYANSVELHAQKPEDVGGLGLEVLYEAANTLAPPLLVAARYDRAAALLHVEVKGAGRFKCRIEVSPDPLTPGSFVALPGNATRRALAGYPPGGYWVRAALLSAGDQSDFSAPVFVLVT